MTQNQIELTDPGKPNCKMYKIFPWLIEASNLCLGDSTPIQLSSGNSGSTLDLVFPNC